MLDDGGELAVGHALSDGGDDVLALSGVGDAGRGLQKLLTSGGEIPVADGLHQLDSLGDNGLPVRRLLGVVERKRAEDHFTQHLEEGCAAGCDGGFADGLALATALPVRVDDGVGGQGLGGLRRIRLGESLGSFDGLLGEHERLTVGEGAIAVLQVFGIDSRHWVNPLKGRPPRGPVTRQTCGSQL